jgi:hypothetical protein
MSPYRKTRNLALINNNLTLIFKILTLHLKNNFCIKIFNLGRKNFFDIHKGTDPYQTKKFFQN